MNGLRLCLENDGAVNETLDFEDIYVFMIKITIIKKPIYEKAVF